MQNFALPLPLTETQAMKNHGRALDLPLVSTRYGRLYLQFVETHGITATAVLENSGLDLNILNDPDSHITIRQICHVLRRASALLNDATAGFRFGQQLDFHGHGILGFVLLRQEDPRKLARMIVQYFQVSVPLMNMDIQCTADTITIDLCDSWRFAGLRQTIASIYMGSIYSLSSLVCRDYIFECDFPCPDTSLGWNKLADDITVHFDRPVNRVVMSLSPRQPRVNDASMANVLATARSRKQLDSNASLRVVNLVRQEILNNLGRNSSLQTIAEKLDMSPRSLRRHLSMAGTAFSGIRNKVRETFATRYLQETCMSLEKIAHLLGYSDQASFSKAYRNWTGRTPGEIRRLHRT
ncbi:helix-turn-helix domain-containing protein [Alcanivorax sp.]|mgnify:CR=1 FL=1|jgi:AraC-like DNA-binding protein|uniref:AraC family transcriptional regulator n=1 Tax=Alcanivorax sp. TaxID=1872427 RepID=UPI0032D9797A